MTMTDTPDIIYTKVDEAPELASASLLPIIQSFASAAGVSVGTKDISLAGRIIATFPDNLTDAQRIPDDLALLGELVKTPDANVIKLPNISASVPQLVAAVKELQAQGYAIPDYPEDPQTDAEKEIRARFDTIKGSAVNPVLREGNSDRRAAKAVKAFAQSNPHRMGDWTPDSKTRVAAMSGGDFRSNEVSATLEKAATAKIVLTTDAGEDIVLKEGVSYPAGTVVDATFMSVAALEAFLTEEIAKTKAEGVLFSLHMKATMMKVSDPIIFGHAVKAWLAPVFEKFGDRLDELGVTGNAGLGTLLDKVKDEPEIMAAIEAVTAERPPMYMVDSDKGITNLHVPSDVIIDASMPALIRGGGKGWGPDGKEHDAVCVIPDNSYAPVYDASIEFFKKNGKLNPATAGTVQNVGLMAQKAEEYGSHPTTFEMPAAGTVRMILDDGSVLHEHKVEKGDIWRSASTRKAPIVDWVHLAIDRQKAEGCEAIFWLDETRAHDAELIKYVKPILEAEGVADKFKIMAPREATRLAGNDHEGRKLHRDHRQRAARLPDGPFPDPRIGHLGQDAVHRQADAGRRAVRDRRRGLGPQARAGDACGKPPAVGQPRRVLCAWRKLQVPRRDQGQRQGPHLGEAVEAATQGYLDNDNSPQRKAGQPDNRNSHYWFARYWAEALAAQTEDAELAAHFAPIAKAMADQEDQIMSELMAERGNPVDQGGYYHPDDGLTAALMRPSATLNAIDG
jgi:isocitrate dehydrogenase